LLTDSQDLGRSLAALVDSRQAEGRYVLTRAEAGRALGVSSEPSRRRSSVWWPNAASPSPAAGFFVIVPVEYREAGAPPPTGTSTT